MNIACYYEGGIGDILLGHKLAWILKSTIYKDSEFTAFLDTENNPLQARVLKYLFPTFYKEIFTIPSKKYKELWIDSQFGSEKIKGFYINVPSEWKEKIESYDKWYNFHLDSLSYLEYPELEYVKYFKLFPTPEINPLNNLDDYILSHIISTTGTEHSCENWWVEKLIFDIDKYCLSKSYRHIIISTPEINDKYKNILQKCQVSNFYNDEVENICDLISNCKGFIGIDSAWRLISHLFNKPTITLSKNCISRGNCSVSHILRWLPFPETTFPLYNPTNEIVDLLKNMLENKLYQLFPHLALTQSDLSSILIKRDYKINEKKSILNR